MHEVGENKSKIPDEVRSDESGSLVTIAMSPRRDSDEDAGAPAAPAQTSVEGAAPRVFIENQIKRLDKGCLGNVLLTLLMWGHYRKLQLLQELQVKMQENSLVATEEIQTNFEEIKNKHRFLPFFSCCRGDTTLEKNLAMELATKAYFSPSPT